MKLDKSSHIYGLFPPGMKIRPLIFLAFFMLVSHLAWAKGESSPDFMRSIGKIYVVAAVCIIILVTLLIYLILLDRKVSRLEKRHKHE